MAGAEASVVDGAMQADTDSDAVFERGLISLQCQLHGVTDPAELNAAEAALKILQPKVGVCPVQWGSNSIAFRCLDCEVDSSCVQCSSCFFKANHEGHAVRMIKTSGGSCDCGDPSSWDPKGFCPDHGELQPTLDGPEALDCLPEDVQDRAKQVLPAIVEQVDATLRQKSADHRRRAAMLLRALKRCGEVAFGFRHVVCEQLHSERLRAWMDFHLSAAEVPSSDECAQAMHALLLLYVQVSPSFKRRFAVVFGELYTILDKAGAQNLGGLSVQLFTIPEVALELIQKRLMLERICEIISSSLKPFLKDGRLTFSREKQLRDDDISILHRVVYDLGYLINHPAVCDYILHTPSAHAALLEPLLLCWRMNEQTCFRSQHIEYETTVHKKCFTLEIMLLDKLTPLADLCRKPEATFEELRSWYATIAGALQEKTDFLSSFNSSTASFHLLAQRLLVRCINWDLLVDPSLHSAWMDIFSERFVVAMLQHAARTLRFAAEIREGVWVRNGQSMRDQEMDHQKHFRQVDIMTLQACFILLDRRRCLGLRPTDSCRLGPLPVLWDACVTPKPRLRDSLMLENWRATLRELTPAAAAQEKQSSRKLAALRMQLELFWELLACSLGELLPLELAMCGRSGDGRLAERCPTILKRCLVQVLAGHPSSISGFFPSLPKQLRVRESQLLEAVSPIAVRKDKVFALNSDAWQLFDVFMSPPVPGRDSSRKHSAEEAGLAQKEAPLLGPPRAKGVSLAPRIQDEIVDSLADSSLVDMVLDFVQYSYYLRVLQRTTRELGVSLETAFTHCIKVIDVIYDASGLDGGPSSIASRFNQPPSLGLTLGQCVEADGGRLGTIGTEILSSEIDPSEVEVIWQAVAGEEVGTPQTVPRDSLRVPAFAATRHGALMERLAALHKAGPESALLARILSPQALQRRLQDRWRALGMQAGEPGASSGGDGANTRKKQRMDGMKQRQQAMLERMRQQQRAAAAGLGAEMELASDPEAIEGSSGAQALPEEDWQCATCREGASDGKIVCMLVDSGASNVAKFVGGSDAPMPRFNSCGHLLHTHCCKTHRGAVRRESQRRFFYVDAKNGEFPCPMCRSLSDGALPCISIRSLVECSCSSPGGVSFEWLPLGDARRDDIWHVKEESADRQLLLAIQAVSRRAETAVQKARSIGEESRTAASPADAEAPPAQPPLSVWPQSSAGDVAEAVNFPPGTSSALLAASAADLAVTSAVSPVQLAESGSVPPLYAALMRCAVVVKKVEWSPVALLAEASDLRAVVKEQNIRDLLGHALVQLNARGLPVTIWTLDVNAVFIEALTCGLCCSGLSQDAVSQIVLALLHIRLLQLSDCELRSLGLPGLMQRDSAPHLSDVLPSEVLPRLGRGLVSFLIFAAWLCAAIWSIPAAERTRLAYIDLEDASALSAAAAVLRLPSFTSLEDVLRLGEQALAVLLPCWEESRRKWDGAPALPEKPILTPFVPLPDRFVHLLQQLHRRPCSACGEIPADPALCMLCGALVCMDSKNCRSPDKQEGQCTWHARCCGAGQGLFLLPFMAMVLAVSAPVCCLWAGPYVDQNGELNPHIARPVLMQMRLDQRQLKSLQQTFTVGAVHREIIKWNEKNGRYIPNPL